MNFNRSQFMRDAAIVLLVGIVIYLVVRDETSDRRTDAPAPIQTSLSSKDASKFKTPYEANQVRNTITKNQSKIQKCYIAYLETKPERKEGKVHVDWQIEPDGRVKKSEIVSSGLQSPTLEKCILDALTSLTFPPTETDHAVYTSHVFAFQDEESIKAK